ncbi:glycosyltransferase family 4 protein [Tianweitania sp. BSSL-BM11]|uniref:Glycosyltransferase family 4 protein n=2 Tax=Tianweitania aestuarii TaxID=2814886 RepID=A0ABS5RRQ9_9HYPH|nr:glycosyltransferase family 4 protein [Tianweitania aestuarii]
MPMKVVMTVNAAWNIVNFRRSVLNGLIAAGHEVTVLAPPDDSVTELARLGAAFVPLTMNVKGLNPLDDLKLLGTFKRHLRDERPDIVLSYTIKNNVFGALAAKAYGIPFIPNVSGLGTAFLSNGALRLLAETLYRRAFSKLPIIFFQNGDDRTLFVQRRLVHPEQGRLLPGSGIDLGQFAASDLPAQSKPTTFLMIARLLRDKGVVEFVEAARLIKSHLPETRFQLLGAAGSQNRSAIDLSTVQGWEREGVVEYLGTTTDVRPFIEAAHCVVLPSYREGAPRTLIEAAAMARPLIATDVPGCRSIVDEDVTGFLCAPRSANSLAAAMKRFLDLPQQARTAMGLAGRLKMEREFDQTIVLAAYNKAIGELTTRRQ